MRSGAVPVATNVAQAAPELPAVPATPLSEAEVQNAHAWNLVRSGKLDGMIAAAVDDGLARVLGKG